jgi:hypothetical protein
MIALEFGKARNEPAHRKGRQCGYVKQPPGGFMVLQTHSSGSQPVEGRAGFGE